MILRKETIKFHLSINKWLKNCLCKKIIIKKNTLHTNIQINEILKFQLNAYYYLCILGKNIQQLLERICF